MSTTPVVPNKRTVFESIRTIVGNENQVRRELGLPYTVRTNSTLNQYLNIMKGIVPPSNQIPTIGYFCIGAGGISMQNCNNNTARTLPFPRVYQHTSDKSGLFKLIPFVMRELNNDLTPQERAKYALRRKEIFKNVEYYAYYLKRLDLSQVLVETKILTKQTDGTFNEREFRLEESDLSPVEQELSVDQENVLKATYARTLAPVRVQMGKKDVEELYNVFNILTGNPMEAVVTEIGLVSGIDRVTEVATVTGRANFTEVIAAQISHINTTLVFLGAQSAGFTSNFNIGVNEPIYNIGQNRG